MADLTNEQRDAIGLLVGMARAAFHAADDTEDAGDPDFVKMDRASYETMCAVLDELDALPDDKPGVVMGPAAKAQWALRDLLASHSGVKGMCGSNGTVDCQSTPASQRCAACPHKTATAGVALDRNQKGATTMSDKITIRYERAGRCFWHIGCTAQRHSPPMRIGDFKEPQRTALYCVACGEGGWFPDGGAGDTHCERIPAAGVPASDGQTVPGQSPAPSACTASASPQQNGHESASVSQPVQPQGEQP
jgi:hypothetical protein